ncbi:hypothetical protein NPIL_83531 [Nephila pilipes]|uniref:Uncharacterized protein n=1 Tax=Nephila pilipes TaxID=299642 RepID=A0A8X6PAC1_NEPPI|nr:hypothetical protein NPIL_83531 [Nephila pilipes]
MLRRTTKIMEGKFERRNRKCVLRDIMKTTANNDMVKKSTSSVTSNDRMLKELIKMSFGVRLSRYCSRAAQFMFSTKECRKHEHLSSTKRGKEE